MIPDDIREAARRSLDGGGPLAAHVPAVRAGELSVARSTVDGAQESSLARVVAVVSVEESSKTVVVQLATNEIENATDLDLIVKRGEAGVPFALAVQSELYGPLFSDQLHTAIGNLDGEKLCVIATALLTDGESLEGLATGAPLGGPDDPRRAFKERELEDLESLTSACRKWLAGNRSEHAVIDPRLLVPPPSGTARDIAEDQFLELLDAVAALDDGPIEIPSEFFEGTDEFLDDVLRWRRDFGLDASRVLSRVRLTELEDQRDRSEHAPAALSTEDVPAALRAYLTACARAGRRIVDVQSVHRCWGNEEVLVVAGVGARYCRARAYLVEAA